MSDTTPTEVGASCGARCLGNVSIAESSGGGCNVDHPFTFNHTLIIRVTMSSHQPLPKTPISRVELLRTNGSMLALTSFFVLARAAVQVSKRRAFELPDFFIYLSYILYIALW